jgi:hypothetical protein
MATDAYKQGIKNLTTEQLLHSRDVLYTELKKQEETVAMTQGKIKALNDLMAAKAMGLAARVEGLERVQRMMLEALQVYYPSLYYY